MVAYYYIALSLMSEHFSLGKDAKAGFYAMLKDAPDHFKMILLKPGPHSS
jgi:SSS family solute:Na+ symporter